MRIGTSIVVAAIGAILAFAVKDSFSGVDLRMIGIILMVAGALGLLLEVIFFAPRRRVTSERTVSASTMAPAVAAPAVVAESASGRQQDVVERQVTEERR